MQNLHALALLLCSLTACASSNAELASPATELMGEAEFHGAPGGGRLIIRSASIDVTVLEPDEAARQLEARAEALSGYIRDSTIGEDSVTLQARIPATKLTAFLDEAAALGSTTRRVLSGEDVTDRYSDLTAKINNLGALRDRLRVLLNRATDVDEVLKVERELTRVQTEYDAAMTEKMRMDEDVTLSAVHVTLNEKTKRRILGPIGLLYEGTKWVVIKLFVISP
jgi:hypothetical protein